MSNLTPEEVHVLLRNVGLELNSGNYKALFKYLAWRKQQYVEEAQALASCGDINSAASRIMTTVFFDEILGWQDHGGKLVEQIEEALSDLKV